MNVSQYITSICPSCGQPVIPAAGLSLPPIKTRIFETVRRRPGVDTESLREAVWANDPNGGPENRKAIHVHVNQLNRLLRRRGVVVRHDRGLGGYRIKHL
jgi:hypothetical protein